MKQIIGTDKTLYGEMCETMEDEGGAIFEVKDSKMAIKLFNLIQQNPEIQKVTIIHRLPKSETIAQNP
jgi:hypothetical protein